MCYVAIDTFYVIWKLAFAFDLDNKQRQKLNGIEL